MCKDIKVCNILGVEISIMSIKEAVHYIIMNCKNWRGLYICFSNVHTVVMAYDDSNYRKFQNDSIITFPDGKPIALMCNFYGFKKAQRIAGPDVLEAVLKASTIYGLRHFFYGSTPDTIQMLENNIKRKYPEICITGSFSPPFYELTQQEEEKIIKMINDSNSDLIWIGLGAPKQEAWMFKYKNRINALMLGVGAAFDFQAETIKRAPLWMRKMCLEWLFRISQDPKRLLKRYIFTNIKFIIYILKQLFTRNCNNNIGI